MDKKRYAIIGTGVRARCFADGIRKEFPEQAELVALFDRNPMRMKGFNDLIGADVPAFTDFSKMVETTKPTHAIITTPDFTHQDFIAQAFEHGLDAITEKPMAIDAEKVRRIRALEREHGREVVVTFNYRYVPYAAQLKELLMGGRLGRILSLNLDWFLDNLHGAEYFRRWHARMENSGGLLVHKATHHFDLLNWLLDDEPAEVMAFGSLEVYGRNGPFRGERCSTCPHAGGECKFEMRTHKVEADKETFDKLYWEAEAGDGYIRDACVFREEIDIPDTMSVLVRYKGGAQLSYSLNAYAPVEGYRLSITGEDGRLEAGERHGGLDMTTKDKSHAIHIFSGQARDNVTTDTIEVATDKRSHGGGDARLYRHLFTDDADDPLGQKAHSRAGAMSCLIGAAANVSIAERRPVTIAELLGE